MSIARRHLATAALLATAAVAGWLVWGGSAGERQPAPAVSYTLLDGQQQALSQLKGQVVLVNFWATSCSTCVAEMPEIVATFEKYKGRGYQTVAVAMSYDPPAYVANFASSRKLPFGVAIDNTGAVAQGFGQVQLTPTTFLINKRGEIVKRYVGKPDFEALHALVEKLLAEAA
ncbi:TlpA family protein disulfide reductase [Aquabacterium sp. OR-4]|uniref:TlpA family protein disulfide reductase n=1 Tax=Aquabacterium sp. OR-4 TaxID=2978127 RepID=UPI0021B22634|nr:TlpA disulfide reductase family protein [Aquabacterium sp. OR-4]MDT7834274.1 TlpA disulfide reductase family protein [Aquabacterium sp. OR-4]